jgi:oxygen-independent coproporphyrinogen-3 oxidase
MNGVRSMMGFPSEAVVDTQAAWTEALSADKKSSGGRILYIHMPFCRSRCTFCPFYYGSANDQERNEYVKVLANELSQWGQEFQSTPVNSVYFGGGTPSDMTPDEITLLLRILHRHFKLSSDCEVTLESRIDGLDDTKISAAVDNGVNRFSLGVQTFDTALRRKLGRTSAQETVLETLSRLTSCNHASVTADIIYGLPGQTAAMLLNDLETMLNDTALSGFSFYRMHLHERLELARAIKADKMPELPDDETCFKLFKLCEERMSAAGAKRISFKHFSFHPRERNLHNEISAWKVPCLPFGMNAGGRLDKFKFKQSGNFKDYKSMVESGCKPLASAGVFPADFPLAAKISGQLNCRMNLNLELCMPVVPEHIRDRVRTELGNALEQLERDGYFYAESYNSRRLTARGRFDCAKVASSLMTTAGKVYYQEKIIS